MNMSYGEIGKSRSKFGKYIDSVGITQQELVRTKYVSINTVTRACKTGGEVSQTSRRNLIEAINELTGENKKVSDFW